MSSLFADLVSGFDTRRRTYGEETLKREQAMADREFALLSTLAQSPDPEVAALGAAGILEIAGGAKPGKGLRGFLGEADRSTFLPQIQAMLQKPIQAQPGSAMLPGSSPVQPERQAGGPPSMAVPPMGGVASAPPGMEGIGTVGMEAAQAQGLQAAMGAAPPGAGGDGPPVLPSQPIVPMPETPQAKYRRLFPTAGEIAAEQGYLTLRSRLKAISEAITTAGGTQADVMNATMGAAGAPRRVSRAVTKEAEYIGGDGETYKGTVIFDPESQTFTDSEGNPVRVIRELPKNSRPIRQGMNVGGKRSDLYLDPNDLGGPPLAVVETGMPVPADPSAYASGMIPALDANGNRVFVRPLREGGTETVTGVTPPPPAGGMAPEAAEASGLLETVKREIAAREAKQRVPGMPPVKLDVGTIDTIVSQASKGRFKTYAELNAATKKVTAPAGGSLRERANRMRDRLNQQRGNVVPGGGMPPPGL